MKIRNLTESLESMYLSEKINHENDEINALLRKYVGKKNIPDKARKAIEDAGITVKKASDDWGGTISFIGPHGKVLDGKGRTWRSGPHAPQDKWERKNYGSYGNEGTRGWDLALNNNDYRRAERSADLRKSWDAVDLKGYLDSDRERMNAVDRKKLVDPSYSLPADKYNNGDVDLRPHSDPYRILRDRETDAVSTRNFRRGYYGIKSDDEIEAEVQKFRDELVRKNNRSKEYNQEAEDKASAASAAVDQYLRDKGIRENLNEGYGDVYNSVNTAVENIIGQAVDNLAMEVASLVPEYDPDMMFDWENEALQENWEGQFENFVRATTKYLMSK